MTGKKIILQDKFKESSIHQHPFSWTNFFSSFFTFCERGQEYINELHLL